MTASINTGPINTGPINTEAQFNELMGGLDRAMIIVTTASRGERAGCLVGFHVQCSIDPSRYAVWLSKANHTYRVGLLAQYFAVHFPSSNQRDLAELFGGSTGDTVDKFSQCPTSDGIDGVPLLTECPNRFIARRTTLVDDSSDHVCMVLEPIEVSMADEFAPLLFADVADIEAGHDADERQGSAG